MNSLENQLQPIIKKLVGQFKKKQLLLLSGPVGVGKTTFIRHLLEFLQQKSTKKIEVSSPTYSLHQKYQLPDLSVDHFDLYRLQSGDELENIGLYECLEQSEGLIIIEWADRLDKDFWPSDWARLELAISFQPDGQRQFDVNLKQ